MAMVDMACHTSEGPINLKQISARQKIAVNYLEQIFLSLKRAGLVHAVKGPGGGYLLAHANNEITVADVLLSVNKEFKLTRCTKDLDQPSCMSNNVKCLTHYLWSNLGKTILDYLRGKTLADVIDNKRLKIYLENE